MAAHQGATRTCNSVANYFFWPGMTRDIVNHVLTCHSCLITKRWRMKSHLPLTLRQLSSGPFQDICIDTIGPVTASEGGNKYIQVVVDFYSRFCVAWPTKRIDAHTFTGEFFENFICKFGLPTRIYADNGPTFVGEHFKEMCRIFGIKLKLGIPYRPKN